MNSLEFVELFPIFRTNTIIDFLIWLITEGESIWGRIKFQILKNQKNQKSVLFYSNKFIFIWYKISMKFWPNKPKMLVFEQFELGIINDSSLDMYVIYHL